jgi:hypothetical protein
MVKVEEGIHIYHTSYCSEYTFPRTTAGGSRSDKPRHFVAYMGETCPDTEAGSTSKCSFSNGFEAHATGNFANLCERNDRAR